MPAASRSPSGENLMSDTREACEADVVVDDADALAPTSKEEAACISKSLDPVDCRDCFFGDTCRIRSKVLVCNISI